MFRPPAHPMLLSVFLGSGIQIFSMVLIILGEEGGVGEEWQEREKEYLWADDV